MQSLELWELALLNGIQNLRFAFLDIFMVWISSLADHGRFWIALAILLLLFPKTRKYGLVVALSLMIDLIICNGILKPFFSRLRPFQIHTDIALLVSPPGDASFPSGHTACSFAAAFGLKFSGSRLWKYALVLATGIAFSRLYLYVHWPSDVLAGAVSGALFGCMGAKLTDWLVYCYRKMRGKMETTDEP